MVQAHGEDPPGFSRGACATFQGGPLQDRRRMPRVRFVCADEKRARLLQTSQSRFHGSPGRQERRVRLAARRATFEELPRFARPSQLRFETRPGLPAGRMFCTGARGLSKQLPCFVVLLRSRLEERPGLPARRVRRIRIDGVSEQLTCAFRASPGGFEARPRLPGRCMPSVYSRGSLEERLGGREVAATRREHGPSLPWSGVRPIDRTRLSQRVHGLLRASCSIQQGSRRGEEVRVARKARQSRRERADGAVQVSATCLFQDVAMDALGFFQHAAFPFLPFLAPRRRRRRRCGARQDPQACCHVRHVFPR
eukprot:scaffold68_cov340-Pavlova_lutheri.AAC.28